MPGSPDPGNTRTSYRYDLDTNTNFVRSRSRTSGPAIKGSDVLLFRHVIVIILTDGHPVAARSRTHSCSHNSSHVRHLYVRYCISTLYRLSVVLYQ